MTVTNGTVGGTEMNTSVTTTLTLVEDLREGDVCRFIGNDATVATLTRSSDRLTVTFESGVETSFWFEEGVFNLVEVAV